MKEKSIFRFIETNNLSAVIATLSTGINLEEKDNFGFTPVECAVRLGNIEIAKVLIDAGAKVNFLNEHMMKNALLDRKNDLVKFLIEMGIDVNLRFKEYDDVTALIIASELGNLDIVKYLIKSGVNVNLVCRKNSYALLIAAFHGRKDICKCLAPNTSPKLRETVERLYPKMFT